MAKPQKSPSELLEAARDVLRQEAEAIRHLADLLGEPFEQAVHLLRRCSGMVVVTGMGKAGLIGAKTSATFASTGTRSLFLHPAEAVHGDLGRIYHEDVVLALSRSGTTEEVVRLLPPLKRVGTPLIAITSNGESPLARHADLCLNIGPVVEACPLGLAPTTSTSVMLALGDALAVSAMHLRKFSKEEFARFHPAGDLGRRLLKVSEVMREGDQSPTVSSGASVQQALQAMTDTRAGAVAVIDPEGRAVGFFTDGDLRRYLLVEEGEFEVGRPIDEFMTRSPITIGPDQLATEAVHLMKQKQLDQVPVVDDERRLVGLLDVQDLIEVGLV